MGGLSTHVLDTANGKPAKQVPVRLFRVDTGVADSRALLHTTQTNDDGRTDAPLLAEDAFTTGTYELEFDVAEYFAGLNNEANGSGFLTTVTIRFSMADDTHYHVPLLVSPWSYSTYRGS